MHRFVAAVFTALLCYCLCPSASAQLRYNSEYSLDRINTEQTSFTLQSSGVAEYYCASEWTTLTVQLNLTKTVFFLWHFKNGIKGFARQVEYVGDIGARTEFILTHQSSDLEDKDGTKIQPMTRDNYPIRVEVWIGESGDKSGHNPEVLIDKACFDAPSVEFGKPYHLGGCTQESR